MLLLQLVSQTVLAVTVWLTAVNAHLPLNQLDRITDSRIIITIQRHVACQLMYTATSQHFNGRLHEHFSTAYL